jgi:hypothetical protein
MEGQSFSVNRDESFSLIVAEDEIVVYERYSDAVDGITDTLVDDAECFVAEVAINSEDGDDVSVTLEQVAWQQIIRDMVVTDGD